MFDAGAIVAKMRLDLKDWAAGIASVRKDVANLNEKLFVINTSRIKKGIDDVKDSVNASTVAQAANAAAFVNIADKVSKLTKNILEYKSQAIDISPRIVSNSAIFDEFGRQFQYRMREYLQRMQMNLEYKPQLKLDFDSLRSDFFTRYDSRLKEYLRSVQMRLTQSNDFKLEFNPKVQLGKFIENASNRNPLLLEYKPIETQLNSVQSLWSRFTSALNAGYNGMRSGAASALSYTTGRLSSFGSALASQIGVISRYSMNLGSLSQKMRDFGGQAGLITSVLGGAGLAKIGSSFIETGKQWENAQVTLQTMLKSKEEAKKLLDWTGQYAQTVVARMDEIRDTAVTLTAVFGKSGREAIQSWIPVAADLQAVFRNLSMTEIVSNLTRSLSAGIAAADLFRERGISSALGFEPGKRYTPEETRDMFIKAFTDIDGYFAHMGEKLAGTLSGLISMIGDKMEMTRLKVMDAGAFGELKGVLKSVNDYWGAHQDAIGAVIIKYSDLAVRIVALAGAFVALKLAVLSASFVIGNMLAALNGLLVVNRIIASFALLGSGIGMIRKQTVGAMAVAAVATTAFVGALLLLVNAFEMIRTAWTQNINGFKDKIANTWALMKVAIYDTVTGIYTDVVNAFNAIKTTVVNAVIFMTHAIVDALTELAGKVSGLWNAIIPVGWIADKAKAIGGILNSIAGNFAGNVKTGFNTRVWEYTQGAEVAGDAISRLFSTTKDLFGKTWEQAKKDFSLDKFFNLSADMGPKFMKDLYDPEIMKKLMVMSNTDDTEKAKKELEKLIEKGRDYANSINIVKQTLADASENMKALGAAGLLTGDVLDDMAKEVYSTLSDVSKGEMDKILEGLRASGAAGATLADKIVSVADASKEMQRTIDDMYATAEAQDAWNQKLKDSRQLLDDITGRGSVATAISNIEMISSEIQRTGRQLSGEEILSTAQYFWDQYGSLGADAINQIRDAMDVNLPDIVAAFTNEKTLSDQEKYFENLNKQVSAVGNLSGAMDELATAGGKNNKIFSAMSSGLKIIEAGMKAFQAAAEVAAAMTVVSMTNALSAVLSLAAAVMGLFHSAEKEATSGFGKVMDEIGESMDQWADDLTDKIVEFVKTMKFSFSDFLNTIAEDMLRITIRYALVQPAMEFLQNKDGNVFSKGKVTAFGNGTVVSSPTFFPMANGLGLMGEAGDEAIMPLKRDGNGRLGVSGVASSPVINIIDQRSSGEQITVSESVNRSGQKELTMIVRDAVRSAVASGSLDDVLGMTYGLRRAGV